MDLNNILKQIEGKQEAIIKLDKAVDYAYKTHIEPLYEEIKEMKEEIDSLKAQYISSLDLSDFTVSARLNNSNNIYYELASADEERKMIDLIEPARFKTVHHHYHIGDDIFTIFVNDYQIHFNSTDILAAQKRHDFKLDIDDLKNILKERTQELEKLTKLMEHVSS